MTIESAAARTAGGSPSGPPALVVRWFHGIAGVDELECAWTDLESRATQRTVFARWRWRSVWYRHLVAHGEEPLVGTAWAGDRLVGVAPLARVRGRLHGVPLVRVDFSGRQSEQGEFLVDDRHPAAGERLFASLLDEIRPDAGTIIGPAVESEPLQRLVEIARSRRLRLRVQPHHYSVVRLDAGYDAYFASLASAFRRNVRSRQRKLDEIGTAVDRFGDRGEPPETIRAAVERMIGVAQSSWRAGEGDPLPEPWRSIYMDAALAFAAEGKLRLDLLVVGGRDAAFFYALVEGDTLYDVTIGYHEEFKSLSPGTVLMQRLLAAYVDEGIRSVVSQGPYPYKRHWSTGQVDQSDLRYFAPTLRGRLGHLASAYVVPALARWRARRSRWYGAERR